MRVLGHIFWKIVDRNFLEEEVGRREEFFKIIFYRRIGMKNESMKQLNSLKSCPFSPGAIWSEQQVMSVVQIHVPVILVYDKKCGWILEAAVSNFVDNKHFCTSSRLNPESCKRNFNGFKNINLKKIKNAVGAVFTGRAGTITSFIFYEALFENK